MPSATASRAQKRIGTAATFACGGPLATGFPRQVQCCGFRRLLTALDPAAVLQRGYASLQRADDGLPIFSVAEAEPGTTIVALLADGALKSSVDVALPRSPGAIVS